MTPTPPPKPCVVCGRSIEWRKKWERDWDEVRYCSKACRTRKLTEQDRELERAILALLGRRSAGASICPSEAARAVEPDDWRSLVEPARMAARRLAGAGKLVITQKRRVVDPADFRGPVRLRLPG